MPARVPEAIHVPAHESGRNPNELFRLHKLVFNLDKNVRHVDNMVKSMLSGSKPKVSVLIDKELEEVMELRKDARKQKQDESKVNIPTTNSLHKLGIQEVVMELFRTGFQHRILTKLEVRNLARKVVGKALGTGADRVGAHELFDGVKAARAFDTFKYDLPPLEDDQTIMRRVAFGDPSQQIPHMSEGTVDRFAAMRHTWSRQEEKLSSGIVAARDIKTTFADIRAPEDTVEALKTLTSLSLLRPEAFSYGVLATDKIPGLLLYGPPGTGKTLLAKAVAKESGATVLDVSGADLNDMYVGEGEKNVKALFSLAKKLSPCIVFIDEADAIFAARGGQSGSQRAHRDLINQFLREWDGMKDMGTFIMIATNRPFDLDDAVLRRLPRRLLVDLPAEKDREVILKIHLKGENLAEDVSIADIAKDTPLYSGSDLKNVCVAAALACIKDENAEATKWTGEGKYVYPAKRTLKKGHFKKALDEISASVSEDMSTLAQIRKFDERYGDRKGRRKKKSSFGFGKGEEGVRENEEGRVRTAQL
jgi:AAA+ superfamily predicted ATPase